MYSLRNESEANAVNAVAIEHAGTALDHVPLLPEQVAKVPVALGAFDFGSPAVGPARGVSRVLGVGRQLNAAIDSARKGRPAARAGKLRRRRKQRRPAMRAVVRAATGKVVRQLTRVRRLRRPMPHDLLAQLLLIHRGKMISSLLFLRPTKKFHSRLLQDVALGRADVGGVDFGGEAQTAQRFADTAGRGIHIHKHQRLAAGPA
jgi:hypothetical protein